MRLAVVAALLLMGCQSEAQAEKSGAVERKLAEPGRPFTIGVVADAKEPLPATLDNLKRFAGVFSREKVAAVLALGGLGTNEDEIARVLGALKEAHAPLLALPGDREPEAAFHAAVERARKAGLDVVDLAHSRVVDGGGFVVVALPGYRWPHYLGAGAFGCRYDDKDVQALRGLFDGVAGDRPRILASHTPPRGDGPEAVDWAMGGANVGDPALAKILPSLGAQLVAFAHVDEAGGRGFGAGADADGGASKPAAIAENAWAERLWLNAGAADSVPHLMGQGGSSRGQAALVEFSDGKLRFRVVR